MTMRNFGRQTSNQDTAHVTLDPLQHLQQYDAIMDRHANGVPNQIHTTKLSRSNLLLPRSPLIGRDHEVAAVQHLLLKAEVGLLTLSGPGGVGKTRLALQVAAHLLNHFVDGVYFVSLASISDPGLVSTAIAQTLGVRETAGRPLQDNLTDFLRDRQLLLVLDNFEQMLAAAPLVAELLAHAKRLKVLVTSRATLHLYGEHEFPVLPLALPDNQYLALGETEHAMSLAQVAAVALFIQRAVAVKPDFALTATNAMPVAEICIRLDGLPLAIELAATKLKLFSPSTLLTRLQQRLTLLSGGPHDLPLRQRTLRDEIAWSYELLTAYEQMFFRRLAVFSGGFTLEAAQVVGDGDGALGGAVLDGIADLVDQNLLIRLQKIGDEPRFGMLETIREYGLEQLAASGEAERIHRRHADFFLALAEATESEMFGPRRGKEVERLAVELDNLRAAIVWYQSIPRQEKADLAEALLRLASALAEFMMAKYLHNEARSWLVAVLQRSVEPTAARAKALWAGGLMALLQNDYQHARSELEESVALWRKIGESYGLAVALCELCGVAYFQGQFEAAQRIGEESVALFRTIGNQPYIMRSVDNLAYALAAQQHYDAARRLLEEEIALIQHFGAEWYLPNAVAGLGWLAGRLGDYVTARDRLTEALELTRSSGHLWGIAEALNILGEVLQRQREFEQAGALYREGLQIARDLDDNAGMGHFLHNLGTLAQDQRQYERATCLFAVAASVRNLADGVLYRSYVDHAAKEGALAAVRMSLDERTFASKWTQGQTLTLNQAIEYALVVEAPEPLLSPVKQNLGLLPHREGSRTYPAGLTAREVEVLQQLAQGLTYAQIADNLVISPRTVNGHITSLYSKLGVSSRMAATRFAIDYHLI